MFKNIKLIEKFVYPFYAKCKRFYYREHIINKRTGKRSEKKYYIIRRPPKDYGFFSNFFYVLGHIVYANNLGYFPVIDMKNYTTLYNEKFLCQNTMNAWEYYFEQPMGNELKIAYETNGTILSSDKYFKEYVPLYTGKGAKFITQNEIDFLNDYVERYIHVKKSILDEIDIFWNKNIKNNSKVLGIHYRGTDMNVYPGHPRPIVKDKCIDIINRVVEEEKLDYVIVCTDENEMIELVKDKVKCRIVYTDSFRTQESQVGIHQVKEKRKAHNYKKGKEVLEDVLILARCDYFICGYSNVAYAALLFNNNKYKKVILAINDD